MTLLQNPQHADKGATPGSHDLLRSKQCLRTRDMKLSKLVVSEKESSRRSLRCSTRLSYRHAFTPLLGFEPRTSGLGGEEILNCAPDTHIQV